MRLYLDTSALVKLYVDEEGATTVRTASDQADLITTSALAYVEARSAFSRRRHEGALSPREYRQVVRDLDEDWPRYLTIQVVESLIREAARLVEVHRLRAYNAIHLASAATARREIGHPVVFSSWDGPLEQAARREGLEVLAR
jgi:predicted nucleic acid-binding protein